MRRKQLFWTQLIAVLLFLIIVFFALAFVGIIKLPAFMQSVTTNYFQTGGDTISLNQQSTSGYSVTLSLNPDRICVGGATTGSIYTDMPNGFCSIYDNPGTGWTHLANVRLNANGDFSQTQNINTPGVIDFQAICCDQQFQQGIFNCKVSNRVTLTVVNCTEPGPEPGPSETKCSDIQNPTSQESCNLGYCDQADCIYKPYNVAMGLPARCECVGPGGYDYGQIGTVFVTSNNWNGAMGGLAGMDEKCQVSAISYGKLSGNWIALASDMDIQAKNRVPDMTYYLLNGNVIANNKADLFDGSIQTALNVNEYGQKVGDSAVWTGSYADGSNYPASIDTCNNWKWVSESYSGAFGTTSANDYRWLGAGSGRPCSQISKIYCLRVS